MKRRNFIGSAGLAGILAAGMAPAAHANQSVRWRVVTRLPKIMDIAYAGVQTFIRTARELSGGKFEIVLQSGDETGGNVLDVVQRGSVECGFTSAAYYVARDETFALDCALPFGLTGTQTAAWLRHGQGLDLLREFYKGHGVVNFPLGHTGSQLGGWFKKPLRGGDVKGLRMRCSVLGGRILSRLGGRPASLSSDETLKALESGQLDAAEWSAPHDDLRLGLHDHCRYLAQPGWMRGGGMQYSLYVGRRAWEALNDESQSVVEAAADVAHLDMQAQYALRNPLALAELVATGTQLIATPKPLMEAAWKTAQELYAEIAAKNPQWRKVHASQAAFQRTQAWTQPEAGFAAFMQPQLMKQYEAAQKAQKSALARRHKAAKP